jgi:ferredoxin--NADP+ reductase
MIGVPLHTHNETTRYPQPTGMVELLEKRGFRIDRPHEPGNIHFEKYW